jgi:3-phenylpropionate/trans-cinnamate dioxygenase ferredoxin subunit
LYAVAGQTQRRVVCKAEELPPGARRAVDVDGRSICVMNVGGRLYGIRNICPHQGASLCRGTVGSTMLPSKPLEYVVGLENLVLRCPWHGWEFRLDTGVSLFDPKIRVKVYPVEVEDGEIVLDAG